MMTTEEDSTQNSAEDAVPFLHANGYEALVRETRTIEDLKLLYEGDGDSLLGQSDVFTQVAVERILAAHGDDIFKLMSYAFEEGETSEFNEWPFSITDAIFEEILKCCDNIPTLVFLYKSIPGDVTPGVNENYHQRIIERMIEIAGKDLRKLLILRQGFIAVPEFRTMIEVRINAVVDEK